MIVCKDVFADTTFWVALVAKHDEYHARAQSWALKVSGVITTTVPVLFETANALARPGWRPHAVKLIKHIQEREDMVVVPLSEELRQRVWALYCDRPDKGWSLTDCVSFVVMQDRGLTDALTTDEDFRQAGFRRGRESQRAVSFHVGQKPISPLICSVPDARRCTSGVGGVPLDHAP
jgi:predicted nucleic acid-binding protein